MRSIWAGAISFGLVVIPVKLYAATEQRDITFRQVHRKDGARIQFRRVCTLDGEEVPYSDIAKGYELPTGDMVVLTDEDLADLPLVTAHRIEVLHFAPSAQVEPIYAAKSYYTEPEPAGVRAYVLFRDALEDSGKVAVAKVALRQREALAALRVREGVITLETLLWPDEVRKPDFAFLDEEIEVRSQELKMAASLIDTMTEDFDPDQYHDAYREALEAVVRAKVEGNDIVRPAGLDAPVPKGQPADLTEILRASVAAVKSGRDRAPKDGAPKDEATQDEAKPAKSRTRRQASALPREPKGAAPPGLTSEERARREGGASRAPGGERDNRARTDSPLARGVSLPGRPQRLPAQRAGPGRRARLVRARAGRFVAELDRPDGPAPPRAGR
jgi:DNA end-binding protein Ku